NIQLPNSSSSILNRVTGGYKSYIDGTLTSNGNVFLVNPAGISISSTANITVGSLTASTLNISDQNYLNNTFVFERGEGDDPAGIDNDGTLVSTAGSINLIGASISNTGDMSSPEGTVNM